LKLQANHRVIADTGVLASAIVISCPHLYVYREVI
jgi:hypothetical protein